MPKTIIVESHSVHCATHGELFRYEFNGDGTVNMIIPVSDGNGHKKVIVGLNHASLIAAHSVLSHVVNQFKAMGNT